METTVDLGGVRTWYAVDGAGEPLVYLHGGSSDADELDPIRAQYAARFRVYSPDRRGHGRTADVEGAIDFVGQRVLSVPGTSHVLILEKPDLVARLVLDFLTTDPVQTRVPIRRRA